MILVKMYNFRMYLKIWGGGDKDQIDAIHKCIKLLYCSDWVTYCNEEKTDKDAKNPKYMNEF